jgi:predicted RNA polymerase sigma factor
MQICLRPKVADDDKLGVVLQLVGLGVPNILEKFPFPAPVDPLRLTKAKNVRS